MYVFLSQQTHTHTHHKTLVSISPEKDTKKPVRNTCIQFEKDLYTNVYLYVQITHTLYQTQLLCSFLRPKKRSFSSFRRFEVIFGEGCWIIEFLAIVVNKVRFFIIFN